MGEGSDIETIDYVTTSSPEAYKYFIEGMEDFWTGRGPVGKFRKAIEIDSTFTSAYFFISLYFSSIESYNAAKWAMLKADEGKHGLPPKMQFWLEAFKSQYIDKNPYRSIRYFKQVSELDPFSRLNWLWLASSYKSIGNYDEAFLAYEQIDKLNKQFPLLGIGDHFQRGQTQSLAVRQPAAEHGFGQTLEHRDQRVGNHFLIQFLLVATGRVTC